MQYTFDLRLGGTPAHIVGVNHEGELNGSTASAAKGRIPEEDVLRANIYVFLARALARAPDASFLTEAAAVRGDDSDLGKGFVALAQLAARLDPAEIDREYHDLFIGVGRGELLPYASYYLTGFLNEKPLAKLRRTMAEFGVERSPDVVEPEDHIAAVFDVMAGLISGAFGPPADLRTQKSFFEVHINSWAPYFFRDLEAAESSVFYAPVGTIGRAFLEIEAMGFTMDDLASA